MQGATSKLRNAVLLANALLVPLGRPVPPSGEGDAGGVISGNGGRGGVGGGGGGGTGVTLDGPTHLGGGGGRGLHSSIFRLNISAFCGIGGAFRGCLGGAQAVSGAVRV